MEDKRVSPVEQSKTYVDQDIHQEVSEVFENGNDDEDQSEEVEFESEENPLMKSVPDPGSPTQEEVDDHYRLHIPFRAWCPCCVQGKAKEDPHFQRKENPGLILSPQFARIIKTWSVR